MHTHPLQPAPSPAARNNQTPAAAPMRWQFSRTRSFLPRHNALLCPPFLSAPLHCLCHFCFLRLTSRFMFSRPSSSVFLIGFFSPHTFFFPFGIQLGFFLVPFPPFSLPLLCYSVVFYPFTYLYWLLLVFILFLFCSLLLLVSFLVSDLFITVFWYCTYWLLSFSVSVLLHLHLCFSFITLR